MTMSSTAIARSAAAPRMTMMFLCISSLLYRLAGVVLLGGDKKQFHYHNTLKLCSCQPCLRPLRYTTDMEHHAYLVAGDLEKGRAAASAAAALVIGGSVTGNPDIILREYSLFSVDDARALYSLAWQRPLVGEKKALIISASRLYHEAQNALLKLFEEPPADTLMY